MPRTVKSSVARRPNVECSEYKNATIARQRHRSSPSASMLLLVCFIGERILSREEFENLTSRPRTDYGRDIVSIRCQVKGVLLQSSSMTKCTWACPINPSLVNLPRALSAFLLSRSAHASFFCHVYCFSAYRLTQRGQVQISRSFRLVSIVLIYREQSGRRQLSGALRFKVAGSNFPARQTMPSIPSWSVK